MEATIDLSAEQVETSDFWVQSRTENHGHGDIELFQVIPKGLDEEAVKKARKQIVIMGYNPSGKGEREQVESDLLMFAQANKQAGDEPMVMVGVAYTGRRANSTQLVEGRFAPGVEVTQLQLEKAEDLVAATKDLIDGNNAEIVAHSAGGPVAQLAVELGLPADTVGLFNAGGLHSDKKALYRRPSKKATEPSEKDGLVPDRLKRSRTEFYGAYFSRTKDLLAGSPETHFVVGNSKRDRLYPRRWVRKVMRKVDAPNVASIDLDWSGHNLGKKDITQRRARIGILAGKMRQARQNRGEASVPSSK